MGLIKDMKRGVGITLILGLAIVVSQLIFNLVSPLAEALLILIFPDVLQFPDFWIWLLVVAMVLLIIGATLVLMGKLKRLVKLKILDWFRYIVMLRVQGEPAMGLVPRIYRSFVDGRVKGSVLYSHSPNPYTGWVFSRDVGKDMSKLITIPECRSLIEENDEYESVDDVVVRGGYIVIISDLNEDDPKYALNDYFLFIVSLGTRGLPGEVVQD